MMRTLILTLFLCLARTVHAQSSGEGIGFQFGLGYSMMNIENPDTSIASYAGQTSNLGLVFPIGTDRSFRTTLELNYKAMNLENNGAISATEIARHSGIGAGMTFASYNLFLGLEYAKMTGEQYLIGLNSNETKFDYNIMNTTIGYEIKIGGILLSVGYTLGKGNIPKSETGLSKNSDIGTQTFMIQFKYISRVNVSDVGRG